ncbi:hypothetical protein [Thermomonospora umbrina]|uniref:Uncharacterized protein n=1 Tax=Thermomonospora umbrina TaxID=111806 RepID=A0A3D9SVN8_9ACTN|nr:hypothetical protein [Thermomonospora umbrina]REE96644.1 hypothetical protein DFJ69_2084 [Thermomonospora umbrina]
MTASAETTEFHYVVTVQWPIGPGGFATYTATGTIQANTRATRQEAYEWVMGQVVKSLDAPSTPSVLFWSLEPNRLVPNGGEGR